MAYPVKVVIFEKRGQTVIPVFDRAKRVRDKHGVEVYLLKKKKAKLPAIDFKNLLVGNMLYLYSPVTGEFHPLSIDDDKFKAVSDKSMRYIYATEIERNMIKFRFKSKLEQWMPLMLIVGTGFILGLLFYLTIPKLTDMQAQTANMAKQMKEVATLLKETIELKCTVQQLPPA